MNKQRLTNATIVVCALTVLGLLAVPETEVLAYGLTGKSWSGPTATYYVNPNFNDPSAGSTDDQLLAVRSGADEWKMSGEGNFQFVYGGQTAIATVALDGYNTVFYGGADGGGALAVCWYWFSGSNLSAFDIEFYDRDGAFDIVWAIDPTPTQFDIQGVACHEFGHALGMDHSGVAGATMYPSVSAGVTANRSIDPDDIAGYQAMYGSGSPTAPVVTSVTPDSGWIDGGYQVTIDGSWFPVSGNSVEIGGVQATNVTRVASSRLTCTVASATEPGKEDVAVIAGGQSGSLTNGFEYESLRNTSTPALGTWQYLEARIPAAPGVFFQGCVSLGNSGIPCNSFGDPSDNRIIPVEVDWLLDYTVRYPQNAISFDIQGFLDGTGDHTFRVHVPNLPSLSGVTFYVCYVTGDMGGSPSGISYIGNSVPIVVP